MSKVMVIICTLGVLAMVGAFVLNDVTAPKCLADEVMIKALVGAVCVKGHK